MLEKFNSPVLVNYFSFQINYKSTPWALQLSGYPYKKKYIKEAV